MSDLNSSDPDTQPPPAALTPPPVTTTGTTSGAGQSSDEAQGRMFPCEGCGADLKFEIGMQKLECPFCGYQKDLSASTAEITEQDFRGALERLSQQKIAKSPTDASTATHEVRCGSCGAAVFFTGTLTSSECPYCRCPIQRQGVHESSQRIPVDAVLPFLIPEPTATENLRAWIRSRWFLPRDLRKRGIEGKLQGVYTPYYTYDAMTLNRYTGERGEHYYVTVGSGKNQRRERRTRWYPASGAFNRFFDDVLVVASRGLPTKLLRALEPWPLDRLITFNAEVLAGHLARTYDIDLDQGFGIAKARMDDAIRSEVCRRIGGDEQRLHSINTQLGALTYKHVLLPVFLLPYLYGKRSYQIAINAGSGEVQGERPYDWVKIVLLIVVVAAIGATVIALNQ